MQALPSSGERPREETDREPPEEAEAAGTAEAASGPGPEPDAAAVVPEQGEPADPPADEGATTTRTTTGARTAAKKATSATKATAKNTRKTTTARKSTGKATSARKATASQTAPAATAEPAAAEASSTDRTPADAPTAAPDVRIPDVRILEHPEYAPELLALAAVRTLGPEAESWVRRTRDDYPTASAHGLARLAVRRFVRLAAAGGAVASAAGLLVPFATPAVLAWAQARLVLHLAAAFGKDPTAVDRAVELLVLTRIHPDEATAREALRAARDAPGRGEPPVHRAVDAAWRLATPFAARTSTWLALRYASRRLPGLGLLVGAAAAGAETERLAARAIAHYRAAQPPPYSQSNHSFGRSV